jgi:chromosome segregation ATPase
MIAVANEDGRKFSKTKVLKKNSNVLLDGVLSFSRPHVEYLYKKHGEEKTNNLLVEHTKKYGVELQKRFGMQLIQVALHLDEGEIKDGVVKKNYHAHISFLNYDFKKHKTVMRTLRKCKKEIKDNDYVTMQDIAGEVFAPLDFLRGVQGSKKKHLEREEYIKFAKEIEKLKLQIEEKDQLIDQKSNHIIEKNAKIFSLETEIRNLQSVKYEKKITIQEFDKKIRALEKTGRALSKEIKRYDDTNLGRYFKKLKMDFKEFRISKKKIKKHVSTFKKQEIEVVEAKDIEPLYKLLAKIYNEYKHLMQLAVDYNEKMNEYNHLAVNYDKLDDNYQKILADYSKQNKLTITLQKENSQLKSLLQSTSKIRQTMTP